VFLLGILWPRGNAKGAMAALLTGFVLGAARLVLELNREALGGVLYTYATINFLHFAVLLFTICTAVLLIVSVSTAPPPAIKVDGLTFATTPKLEETAAVERSRMIDMVLSAGAVLLVFAEWWYFSG
jgi:SSS family solute:Na+ symporter